MPSLKEVKNRIQSVNSTQQITKAMKMVAAAKLRKSQDRIIQLRPYSERLATILANVSATLSTAENPFAEVREINRVLLVVVTSDRGLCGSFNSNVIKEAVSLINTRYAAQHAAGNLTLLCIGRRGYEYFSRRKFPMMEGFTDIFGHLSFDSSRAAAEAVMAAFLDGTFDRVEILFNEFKNVATQILRSETFLPLTAAPQQRESVNEVDYIFEPSKEEIIQELIPKSLKITFYRALLESNASENGARMTAMDKATENAAELLKSLKLTYNRTRQAAITKEILEIVGGAEALAQS